MIDAAGGPTSFAELALRVGGLAAALRELGVRPGDRVAVQLPRGLPLVVALLASLQVRAAYVVLDPLYPAERRRAMLEASGPRVLIADEPAGGVELLAPATWEAAREAPVPVRREAGDLAYLAFTSGSTGQPKGVAVTAGAVGDYLAWCLEALPALGHGVPLFASAAFDHAVTCLYPPLLRGEPLKLLPEVGTGAQLGRDLLARGPYSFVKVTPSHLRFLSREQRAALGERSGLVMLGGEACDAELVRSLRATRPELRVMNHYGPTEATVGCLAYEIPPGEARDPVPIGRSMPHVRARIEDGELVVGGRCLAAGYWVGGAVAEAPPFLRDAGGERWYRTGDRVVEGADGALAYAGRVDRQVKVLGHRIELSEVERALCALEGVDAALVLQPPGGQALAAVVTPADGPAPAALRAALAERLPPAAVPAQVARAAALPANVHGKVDAGAAAALLAAPTSPAGDVEALVAEAWREALDVREVTAADDFFALGGDSLAVVEVIDRLQEALGIEVELSLIFKTPVLGDFAEALIELAQRGAAGAAG